MWSQAVGLFPLILTVLQLLFLKECCVVLTCDEGELRLRIWTLSFRLSEFVQDMRVCSWIINLL